MQSRRVVNLKNRVKVITVLVGALSAVVSFAAPVTYTFTGTVIQSVGSLIGQSMSGWLTIDPATFLERGIVNGVTEENLYGTYYAPDRCPTCENQQTDPSQVTGYTTDGNLEIMVGGADFYDGAGIAIWRNWGGTLNEVTVVGTSTGVGNIRQLIALHTYDLLGANSQIFTDPNGGLDVTQDINWFAPGAISTVQSGVLDMRTSRFTILQTATLTSMSVSESLTEIPEPTTLALVGAGLLGVAASRRRRASNRVSPGWLTIRQQSHLTLAQH